MTRQKAEFILPAFPDLKFESDLWKQCFQSIAGVDEAGRGPWAGPVAAGAVILSPSDPQISTKLTGVNDSKKLTAAERSRLAELIPAVCLASGVGMASVEEIDTLGISPATRLAMMRAIDQLSVAPDYLLIDYVKLKESVLPQTSLIKGDARSLSIAAASILAKTARDAWMEEADILYPGYGFAHHKGYGTSIHSQALARLGPSKIHRKTFEPVRVCLENRAMESK
jgi:ribonuclease HII